MTSTDKSENELEMLLDRVYKERGWDFRNYKPMSLRRRLSKRLKALNLSSFGEYASFLDSNPEEYYKFFSTATVRVSEFFREPMVFDILKKSIKEFLPGKDGVRAWCCGCACGEEAYSLAILLAECLDKDEVEGIKVFATDIDNRSIDEARRAVYREEFLRNVPEGFRQKYFFPSEGGLKVKYTIRNLVKFGTLDIVRDSPISKIDILFCRNLFIYFVKALQEKVFEKLDYALRPGGIIVFGKAEIIPQKFSSGYITIGHRMNMYRKRL